MSIVICLLMITSISTPFTQNTGQMQNAEQPQNIGQPTSSSSGTGGLADSPWPMFRQNLNHTAQSPYDTNENPGLLKWSFTTGSGVFSSPAIGIDETIYVGSDDYKLYAINPDGTEKWNFTTGGQVGSSPAIGSDSTIYVGSDDTKLYAINPDGTEKWNFTTGNIVQSSPAIGSDGTIYVGSDSAKLYAINPDGTEKWSYTTNGQIDSSPAISSDGTIYIGSHDTKLYAINPDGTEKWSFTTSHMVQSSPAIGSDGTIYIGSEDKNLYAINPDGTKKWSFITGGFMFPSPTIGYDGTIYVGSYDYKLYAIHPNGTEKWNFKTGWGILSSSAISSDGTIYTGSTDGKLYAINPDGTEKWNFTTDSAVGSSPAIGSDGTIYIGSSDDKLYAIGIPTLDVNVTSYFSELNSAAQSAITVHVTDGTNPVQGATVNLVSNNGGIFSPQSGITDANGNFDSIFNAPNVISQIICQITADTNKTSYNNGSRFMNVTINPIPWPMFGHNCRRTGFSPYDTSSNPGKLKWSYTTGGAVRSSVIDSEGTIYVASDDKKLYAINPNGTQKWNFVVDGYIDNSPTIGSDGTIYTGSGTMNKLYALNPDGIEIWNFTANGRVSSPAIGSDGTIYFSTSDNPGPNPLLYALNSDGTEEWRLTIGLNGRGYMPAIASDGTIYVGTNEDKLYAVYSNGIKKWIFSAKGSISGSPTIGSDGTIYVGSDDNNLYAVNPDGTEKWSFMTGASVNSPGIGVDGTIYAGSCDKKLYAINPDGTEKWTFLTNSLIQTAPAIGSDGTIYIGSDDNNLYAINLDGNERWNFSTGWMLHSSPAIGSDGTIYIGSWDKKLYAIGGSTLYITVDKVSNVTTAKPGDLIDYTIYYNHSGSGKAGTVWINDILPPGVTFVTSSAEVNRTGDHNWTYYNVGYGKHNFTITLQIDNGIPNRTILTNFVHLDYTDSNGIPGPSSWDSVDVTILYEGPGNQPSVADAGPDQTVNEGDVVQFNGTGSYVPNGIIDNYEWDFDLDVDSDEDGNPTNDVDATGSTPTHIYGDDGFYNVTLTVRTRVGGGTVVKRAHDVVFVIDSSGSNMGSDPNDLRITESKNFIVNHFTLPDRAAVVDFDQNAVLVPEANPNGDHLHTNYARIIDNLDLIDHYGGDILWQGMNLSNEEICQYGNLTHKHVIIILTDGGNIEYDHNDICNSYNEANISASHGTIIFTIGLNIPFGSQSERILQNIAEITGGKYFSTPNASNFEAIYEEISEIAENQTTEELVDTNTMQVTVQNVDPTVTIESITMEVEIGLRVAGRKYNNVSMTLYENGSLLGYVSIERMPGSPDEQMAWIPVSINFSKSYNATVTYTPEDPQNVGGNPVWIYIKFQNGSIKKIHHTFNVQQSKIRDSEHWNHVEPWEVELNAHFIGLPFEITSHITDPGSDDETITFTYGSQVKTVTYLNTPPNPDPYPSPEVNPVDVFDTTTLVYEGLEIITLVVKDDDNIRLGIGQGSDSITLS